MTAPVIEIKFHPFADIFPLLTGAAFEALVADIRAHGLGEPIVLHPDGSILDGRNRYRACLAASVEPRFDTWNEQGDALAFVLSHNLHRRHLNETERKMVAARIATLEHGQRQTGRSADVPTQAEAAALMNVPEREVRKARAVLDSPVPELAAAVDRGEIKLDLAEKVARAPAKQQRAALKEGTKALRAMVKQPTPKKEAAKKAKLVTPALDAAEAEDDAIEVLVDSDDTPEVQEVDRRFQLLTKRLDVVMDMLKLSPDPVWHKVVKERLQLCAWLIDNGRFDHGNLPESTNASKTASQDRAGATIATEVDAEVGVEKPATNAKIAQRKDRASPSVNSRSKRPDYTAEETARMDALLATVNANLAKLNFSPKPKRAPKASR